MFKKKLGEQEDSLGLGFGICDLSDEDRVFWVTDVSFFLHVGGSDGKHGAVVVKSKWCDAGRVAVELTQALLVEWVPDVYKAVWATWWKDKLKVNDKWREPYDSTVVSM